MEQNILHYLDEEPLPKSLINLVARKKIINDALDDAARAIVAFSEIEQDIADKEEAEEKYESLRKTENYLASKWDEIFEIIYSFDPKNSFEFGLKISSLAEDIAEGVEDPKYLNRIIEDAKKLMHL